MTDTASLKSPARHWVLAAIVATMVMAAVEGTIVAAAMPTIVARLGGFHLFSWVFTAYLLAQALTTPIYGQLADMLGRKRVLFAGMGLFLAGSVLCGLAWDMPSLIAFRAIQGAGAGALLPVALTIAGDIYAPVERARIQGFLSSAWGGAAILGPSLGAALVTHASWQMVFWVNLPLGVLAAVMLAVGLHETAGRRRQGFDLLGLLLILPPDLWRNRVVVAGSAANLIFGATTMGVSAFLPAYVQGVMGRSALVAGAMLTALAVSWPLGSVLAGRIMLRTSYRTTALLGGLSLTGGSALMIGLEPSRGLAWAASGAILIGLGVGLSNNTFLVVIQASVDWARRGVATSSTVFLRMIGQSGGTALFGLILNAGLAGIPGGGEVVDRLMDPASRQVLPAAGLDAVAAAIAAAMHQVYLINGALALLVVAAALGIPAGISPVRTRT